MEKNLAYLSNQGDGEFSHTPSESGKAKQAHGPMVHVIDSAHICIYILLDLVTV